MKKILFISHDTSLTGAPIYLTSLVKNLYKSKLDYELLILFSSKNGGKNLIQDLKQKNIKFTVLNKITLKKSFFLKIRCRLIFYINFIKLILKYQPDLVYSNTILNFSEVFLSKIFHIPCILHVHEGLGFCKNFKWRLKVSCFLTNTIIVGSRYANNSLFKLTGYKGAVVYNGIKINKDCYSSNLTFPIRLGVLGIITANKGQLVALQALRELIAKGVKVKLKLVGRVADNNYYQIILNYIKEYNLQEHVEINAEVSSPLKFIGSLDILLVPSFEEVFPTVILEAFSIGVPVIASRIGGIPEIIINNKNSLMFKHGNFIELARAIQKLFNNKSAFKIFSRNAINTIDNKFSDISMIYKIKSHINFLI
jgi:glycosyltransferase involved in cell wall biosynthesis